MTHTELTTRDAAELIVECTGYAHDAAVFSTATALYRVTW